MKIFIEMPNFRKESAGIVALHRLAYLLLKMGHAVETAAIGFGYTPAPEPVNAIDPKTDMVIVPEITHLGDVEYMGIPVMRWVLYFPGFFKGPTTYGQGEVVFHWHGYGEAARLASFQKCSEDFTLPMLHEGIYEHEDRDRSQDKDLFMVYKHVVNEHAHPVEAVELDKYHPRPFAEYIDLLKHSRTLYCYDNYTQTAIDAHLCGMKVLIWTDETRSWRDFVPNEVETRIQNDKRDMEIVQAMLDSFKKRAGRS